MIHWRLLLGIHMFVLSLIEGYRKMSVWSWLVGVVSSPGHTTLGGVENGDYIQGSE